MKNFFKKFVDHLIFSTIFLIITPTIIIIWSKIKTGSWFDLFLEIPVYVIIIFLSFILSMIFTLIFKRIKFIRDKENAPKSIYYIYPDKIKVGEQKHKDLIWEMWHPYDDYFDNFPEDFKAYPQQIFAKPTPHCPKCETELTEKETFFWRYEWSCCNCNFKTKSKNNFDYISKEAEKIYRSEYKKSKKNKEGRKNLNNSSPLTP